VDIVYIDTKYVNYLLERDDRVCFNKGARRPYLGPVLKVNGFDYFAPMSSSYGGKKVDKFPEKENDTFLPINNCKDGGIKFNNMIPVAPGCYNFADIKPDINDTDAWKKRKEKLNNQLSFVEKNLVLIEEKAKLVYENKISGCKMLDVEAGKRTCKFSTLENAANKYLYNKINNLPQDSLIEKYKLEPEDFKRIKYWSIRKKIPIKEAIERTIINSPVGKYNSKIKTTLLEERNAVKTSLQSTEQKQPEQIKESNPLVKKYGLTQKEFDSCKSYAEKKNLPLEKVIRSNAAFAPDGHFDSVRSKIITEEAVKRNVRTQMRTQEKNNNQQPVVAKPKKKDSGYNCR